MEDYVDSCPAAEVSVLRRKLHSKAEALLILTRELEQCRAERDHFQLIADQAQNRSVLKKLSDEQVGRSCQDMNKALRYEVQELKQKLREAYGDIKVLRAGAGESCRAGSVKDVTPAHQREELVQQLEQMAGRVNELETDLRSVLDEKEELVTERESYRCKVHRLTHQINVLLKGDTARLVDIDALIMDNKYLQEQMQQFQAEKELAHQSLVKYKSMLERKRNRGIVKLGSQSSSMVVSHKQVQELLERGTAAQLPDTEATLADLRSLCLALLEALQDKTLALAHQRKANKILASRVWELEQRLGSSVPVQLLTQTYSSAHHLPLPDDLSESKEVEVEVVGQPCREPQLTIAEEVEESLPQDIQELVSQALEQIHQENADTNNC